MSKVPGEIATEGYVSSDAPVEPTPLSPRPASLITRYSLLGLLLVGALVWAGALAWNNPATRGHFAVDQAYTLLNQARYMQAEALLEQTLLFYRDPETRLALSFAYLARRDTARAETQARLLLDSSRLDMRPAAWTQLGRVLQAEGRDAAAFDAWQQAAQAASLYGGVPRIQADVRSATWHTAMLHWSHGEWEATRQSLQSLVSQDDVYGRSARVKLAQLLGPSAGDNAPALLFLAGLPTAPLPSVAASSSPASTASSPDMNLPGLGEGLPAATLDSLKGGIIAAREQIRQGQAGGEGYVDLLWGDALAQQGEAQLAESYLQRAVALLPQSAQAHAELGLALVALGHEGDGQAQLQSAEQLDPTLPLPHHALAQLLTSQGQWSAALKELGTAHSLEPFSVQAQFEYGELYKDYGDYTSAEHAYLQAVALQAASPPRPGQPDANLVLAHFYIDVVGQACDKGLPPAQQALADHPGDPDAIDAVGWALAQCGHPTEAITALQHAVQLAPLVPLYRYHLASTLAQAGRLAAARDEYLRVQDLDPNGPLSQRAITDLARLPGK